MKTVIALAAGLAITAHPETLLQIDASAPSATPTADQIEGGIGGLIDLRTRRPFDLAH